MDTFDQLLDRSQAGDSAARDRLVSLVLEDLRGIAAGQLDRERTGHTLQATALVNEAWLRLSEGTSLGFDSRSAFLAAATVAMRRILIDHARGRKAAKRGGAGSPSRSAARRRGGDGRRRPMRGAAHPG